MRHALLNRASQVAVTQDWHTGPNAYAWLNKDSVLYLIRPRASALCDVVRLNTRTGQSAVQSTRFAEGMRLAPAGDWMLTYTKGSPGFHIDILHLNDGQELAVHTTTSHLNLAWTPDAKRLLEMVSFPPGSSLVSYDLEEQAAPNRNFGLPPRPIGPASDLLRSPTLLLLGAASGNRLIFLDKRGQATSRDRQGGSNSLQLLTAVPDTNAALIDRTPTPAPPYPVGRRIGVGANYAMKTCTVAKPRGAFLLEAVLSASGDRIAWLFDCPPESGANSFWRRVFTFLHADKDHSADVWISRADGSNLQEIGMLPLGENEEVPVGLRWTPSGDSLSFLYNGGLYLVPLN